LWIAKGAKHSQVVIGFAQVAARKRLQNVGLVQSIIGRMQVARTVILRWENETDWHRQWKNLFPEECREVVHIAENGEIHRADIKTSTGIIIEVQHSAMTDAERISRESFYKNLVWIIDGKPFKDQFDILHALPALDSDMAKGIIWLPARREYGMRYGHFFRWSAGYKNTPGMLHLLHELDDIKDEILNAYRGHHQYQWTRPRNTWLDASCPVYIDFGDDNLVKLCIYDDSGLSCIWRIHKKKFVHDAMTEVTAQDIGSRFYPIA
jgi:competence protein CoiA